MTELSAAAAESLSKYEGVVSLRGLAVGETDCCFNEEPYSLSEPAAESLSKHEGLLSLGGLLSLHSNALANALVTAVAERRLESDEDVLDLVTVSSLSDDAAEVLARHDGLILLTGLWELSSKSARILLEGTAEVDTFCSLKEIAKG